MRSVRKAEADRFRKQGFQSGAQKRGLKYQAKVLRLLESYKTRTGRTETLVGECAFEFYDRGGRGFCYPDILVLAEDRILILECKLTQTDVAELQIFQLYAPVVSLMWSLPIIGVAVYRNCVRQLKNPTLNIWGLIDRPLAEVDPFYSYHLTL